MGIENYCSCSKEYAEKNLAMQSINTEKKTEENMPLQKSNLRIYENYYKNINLINSNYFSINPTNHNHEAKKWQNCVPQKGTTEIFFSGTNDISSVNNSMLSPGSNYKSSENSNLLNLPMGDKYEGEISNNKPNGKGVLFNNRRNKRWFFH